MYVGICVCVFCVLVLVLVFVFVYCVCVCVWLHMCMYVCVCVCGCVYIYTLYVCVCVFSCTYMYICVFTYACTYEILWQINDEPNGKKIYNKNQSKAFELVSLYRWGEALCVWMSEFPQSLPNLLSILETEILQEIGFTNVAAYRSKQVNERLNEKRTKWSLNSISLSRECLRKGKDQYG